jgi:hypothetical protein
MIVAQNEALEAMSVLDNQTIEIPCPKCGVKHQKTIGWLNMNDRFACSCGVTITLDKQEWGKLREVDDAFASIPKNIVIKFC